MSWRLRISHQHRELILVAHAEAWRVIEARGGIESLDYQAENDRLGYILVELLEARTPEGELVTLAIARYNNR